MTLEVLAARGRGFIMVNAHPLGCASMVSSQFDAAKSFGVAPRTGTALIIGASTGYGLASRVVASVSGMRTVGVFFERPASGRRTASAGWYNSAAFHAEAGEGHVSINADAFADETKASTIEALRATGGRVDLVIYSLASPVRLDPQSGVLHRSVLKPIGSAHTTRSIDLDREEVCEVVLPAATDDEIRSTVAVMGGDDLRRWVDALRDARLLAEGATVVAYSYIGPSLTWPIYRDGTVGEAKKDLEATVNGLDAVLRQEVGGRAVVSVNKAIVTQASAAIPAVPLYISLLYKIMKASKSHEGSIEQTLRLFAEHLEDPPGPLDAQGRIRLDDRELDPVVQSQIQSLWPTLTTENLEHLSDFGGYRSEFRRLFGFDVIGIDYDQPVNTDISIPGLIAQE